MALDRRTYRIKYFGFNCGILNERRIIKMGCITALILICNIGLIIAADVLLWMYSASMGLFGLIGVVVFFEYRN